MNISGIYKIQSKIKPERIYVGSAVNTGRRWSQHLSDLRLGRHGNNKLQNHFNKYGEKDLIFSVIVGCEKDNLISYEQFYIDSLNPFFNICLKAGSVLGLIHSEETRKKLSESHIGLQAGEKHPLYGKKFSSSSCIKMSLSHKGQVAWNKGKKGIIKMSEETKEKMRKAQLGKIMSEESKQKMRKPKSADAKLRMSEAQKGNKNCLGITRSAETRMKMSIARKNRIKAI